MQNTATITITIDDVRKSGSVRQAIIDNCPDDVTLATSESMGGQTFACSGPGSGWQRNFDATDYAKAAIEEDLANAGCDPSDCRCLDPSDGRMASGVNPDENGEWSGEIEWSDESCVCLECPSISDASDSRDAFKLMVDSPVAHKAESPVDEWAKLCQSIRDLWSNVEYFDIDDLAD